MTKACRVMVFGLWALALTAVADDTDFDTALRFEMPAATAGEPPPGWGVNHPGTVALVRDIVHSGDGAVRLVRDTESPGEFTAVSRAVEVDFSGEWLELRGMLRTEDVDRHASLWMRQDGDAGILQFDNMSDRALSGSGDWQPLTIRMPLDPSTRSVVLGVLLVGAGRVWADDLVFEVDGKPLALAPDRVVEPTVLDTDREFVAGSGLDIDALTPMQVEHLAVLGKVWGFLKYHHPRVTTGEHHWDFELFRVLPRMLEARNSRERSELLEEWIDGLGEVPRCEACASERADVHLDAEVEWIADATLLGHGISARLQDIYSQRPDLSEQFYVRRTPRGNPIFDRESAYRDMVPPDAGYRILSLLRLWNIVEYWFPYRDLLEDDRDALLSAFLPRVVQATDADAYGMVMSAFIARIHDGHANLWSHSHLLPPRGECHWPMSLRFVEDMATVVELHDDVRQGEVRVGDVIEAIDEVPVADIVREVESYYGASNRAARMLAIARNLTRGECAEAEITLRRGETLRTVSLERSLQGQAHRYAHDRPGDTFQLLSPEVAYLKLSSVTAADIPEYLERAAGSRGLVIDTRNYPSEFVVFALGQHLVAEETPFARFTRPDPANPGVFNFDAPEALHPVAPTYAGRVAILVDESSISQAEYTAMAFRARPGAVVVGSPTAGADGDIAWLALPGGLRTAVGRFGVFYPDKTPTQRIGIVPDIEVRPTVEGIRARRDEVLEAAIAHILGEDADADEIRRMAAREH